MFLQFARFALAILACAISILPANAEPLTLEHQGIARQYLEHRPAAAPAGPLPLMIYLHGVRPPDWKIRTRPELDALAGKSGFIAVYPKAVREHWNYAAVTSAPPAMAGDQVADDVAYIGKLIELYTTQKGADPARVYIIGDSRGGLMAFSLMCQLADKIAAAAPLITGMTDKQLDVCKPSRPVPLMAVAGTNDIIQHYDGWLYEKFRIVSVPETMEFWRRQHGCTGQQGELLPRGAQETSTRVIAISWTGCKTDNAVKLYRVNGGGHQVPSIAAPASPDWIKQGGAQNHDIETVNEFWTFAKRFVR